MHKVIREDIKDISFRLGKSASLLSGKTVLVTGGLGFLGRYIVGTIEYLSENLLSVPCRLIVVDNHITSIGQKLFILNKKSKVSYIEHDITKPLNIKGRVDFIIHAAGIASPIYYTRYPLQAIDVAVAGTRNMLNLAKKKNAESFLFFSSSEIYGDPPSDKIPTPETYNGNVSPIGPRACYDESKRLGETLCMTYYSLYKTPIKIVRPFNVFGPGMNYLDHRVIPSIIYGAMNKKDILIHSNGKQTRTFCYVTDAINAFFKVLLSIESGQVYNVGNSDNEISMNDLAKLIGKVLNKKIKIKNVSYPKNYPADEPLRRCPDITKLRRKLNYSPKINLEAGFKRTAVWCKENWSTVNS